MIDFTVHEGDCLDVLSTLPDNSVNLIVTSPPYGNQRKATYGGIDPNRYSDWFLPRAAEFMRVLRDDGSFVLNIKEHCENGERHPYVLRLVLDLREQGWKWIEEYCWRKLSAFPDASPFRLRNMWEPLYHFAPDCRPTIYKEAVRIRSAKVDKRVTRGHRNTTDSGFGSHMFAVGEWVHPPNVIEASPSDANVHPAAFPSKIPEFFIKLFTVPGDTVLDPFAGSGTTMLAAYEMDRRAIGIEIVPEYVELIRQRKQQLPMRLPGMVQ